MIWFHYILMQFHNIIKIYLDINDIQILLMRMKQRLDLDTLLKKYQRGIVTDLDYPRPNDYYSPLKSPLMYQQTQRLVTEGCHYYQQNNPNLNNIKSQTFSNQTRQSWRQNLGQLNGFKMSRSECEQFLLQIKEQLQEEGKNIHLNRSNAIKMQQEALLRENQRVKNEVLKMVDGQFAEWDRKIRSSFDSQSQSGGYQHLEKKLSDLDTEINRLMNGLKGNEYKKYISEIVIKDFASIKSDIHRQITNKFNNNANSVPKLEVNRSELEKLKESLAHLYILKQKQEQYLVKQKQEQFQNNEGHATTRSNRHKIFDTEIQRNVGRMIMTSVQNSHQNQKRMRKSFFNFDP